MNCEYILLVCGLPFYFLKDVFQVAEVFDFDEVYFINVFLFWLVWFMS